ncbi:MAG: protein translocase SEC61 complex subunit gamma [Nanoarchaeota archaeon]
MEEKVSNKNKLKTFIEKSRRVWLILKKPTRKEFEMVAKISALGILIIGVVGFLISIIIQAFI